MTSLTVIAALCVAVFVTVFAQSNVDSFDEQFGQFDTLIDKDLLKESASSHSQVDKDEELFQDENDEIDEAIENEDLAEVDNKLDGSDKGLEEDMMKYKDKDEMNLKTKTRDPKCPQEFVYDASTAMCFKVFKSLINVFTARSKCKDVQGGRLVELNTRGKITVLSRYIEQNHLGSSRGFSLGGSSASNGLYKWSSGGEMDFWCPGSPREGKTCLKLTQQSSGMCITDDCCYRPKHYVCEIPM